MWDKFRIWLANHKLAHKLFCTLVVIPYGIVAMTAMFIFGIIGHIVTDSKMLVSDLLNMISDTFKLWKE